MASYHICDRDDASGNRVGFGGGAAAAVAAAAAADRRRCRRHRYRGDGGNQI